MKRRALFAGILSLLIPGLGQIYVGREIRGAAILASAIIIGNLNIIFIVAFVAADFDPKVVWAYWISRIGHDVMSVWSIAFWLWTIFDAYKSATK